MRSLTSSDSDEHAPETQTYFRGVYPCGKRWKAQVRDGGAMLCRVLNGTADCLWPSTDPLRRRSALPGHVRDARRGCEGVRPGRAGTPRYVAVSYLPGTCHGCPLACLDVICGRLLTFGVSVRNFLQSRDPGERGKTNYDKNGELSESIKRRRARPRPHHKRGSVATKPAAISPTGPTGSAYPLSILGKRSLEYTALPRPELHALSSYSSVYTHENDGNTIESLSGSTSRTHSPDSEQLHAQIAALSESRSQVEYLLFHHPMAAAAAGLSQEDLHDEYVVCTIRLDDLMRRVRRKEPHHHSAAGTAAAASTAQPGPATATPSPRNSPGSAPGRPGSAVSDKWHSPPSCPAGAVPPAIAHSMRSSLPLSTARAAHWR